MPNMSYCRMHNTLNDLADCRDYLMDEDGEGTGLHKLSPSEYRDAVRLLRVCHELVRHFYDGAMDKPKWGAEAFVALLPEREDDRDEDDRDDDEEED